MGRKERSRKRIEIICICWSQKMYSAPHLIFPHIRIGVHSSFKISRVRFPRRNKGNEVRSVPLSYFPAKNWRTVPLTRYENISKLIDTMERAFESQGYDSIIWIECTESNPSRVDIFGFLIILSCPHRKESFESIVSTALTGQMWFKYVFITDYVVTIYC